MAKDSLPGSSGQRHHLFARRQVYLRSGQDSHYVELSPLLQVSVALGFAMLALWLIGASYSAIASMSGSDHDYDQAALVAKLDSSEQALAEISQERDAALEKASKVTDLEAALSDAQALAAKSSDNEDVQQVEAELERTKAQRDELQRELAEARTLAANDSDNEDGQQVATELEQTKAQLDELQSELADAKADQAALQAKYDEELSASTDFSQKTVEEAVSLHAKLESANAEIEALKEERDKTATKLETLVEEKTTKDEAIARNTDLLKAATAEIELLQENIQNADIEAKEAIENHEATVSELQAELAEAVALRIEFEREVTDLQVRIEEGGAIPASVDAAIQAQSIEAGLNEADLLAMIEDLRAQLEAGGAAAPHDEATKESEEILSLRQRLAAAKAEIERMILSGLQANKAIVPVSTVLATDTTTEPEEVDRLRAELLTAEADIIKLKADVKAAQQRLVQQSSRPRGPVVRRDNSEKLEQQLASTRTRIQQLNKALASARLREVAIDLALINVVPTPSPPAPR